MEKEYIYIYIELNHYAVHLKLTLYCKSTILQLKNKKQKTKVGEKVGEGTILEAKEIKPNIVHET